MRTHVVLFCGWSATAVDSQRWQTGMLPDPLCNAQFVLLPMGSVLATTGGQLSLPYSLVQVQHCECPWLVHFYTAERHQGKVCTHRAGDYPIVTLDWISVYDSAVIPKVPSKFSVITTVTAGRPCDIMSIN